MLTLVNALISVAKDQLPRELACAVILAIVLELKGAQMRQIVGLEETWKEMDIEQICAAINDSFRMQDKCEDLIEDVGDVSEASEDLGDAMDELCTGYVELAVLATKLAANSVMLDLKEPILQQVFTSKWEEGEELVGVACKTLRDWFGDLSMWLPDYFFSKLVRECYEQTVKCYIAAVFKRKKAFAEPARAAQHIVNDRTNMAELFGGEYYDKLFAAGIREDGAVDKQLAVLTNTSRVLLAPYVYDCKSEIKELLIEFGAQGKDAVFGLIAMRKGNTKESLKEWKGVINGLVDEVGDLPLQDK
jgi:hypothetical protein